MQTVTIRINPNQFGKGLKYAKTARGKYNPASKTWEIPADCNMLNLPGAYGWIIVQPQSRLEVIEESLRNGVLPEDC